jgi:preprotein translocase SecE subunit
VAEKSDDITVSEDEFEIETSTVPETAGGEPQKRTLPSRGGKQRAAAPGFFARTGQFVRDTRAEMRRVSWPTATEVMNTTKITLVAVVFFALYLFGIDRVWAFLIEHLRIWLGGS